MNSNKSNIATVLFALLLAVFYCGAVIADEATKPANDQIPSGTLVIPGDEESGVEKICVTVCDKWGESCMINPRTGSRKCRRVCKRLGEDCT